MAITRDELVNLVSTLAKEIESEDPIDWGMLLVSEDRAYDMMASQVIENFIEKDLKTSAEAYTEREITMMASIVKLVVENFVLNLHLEKARGINNGC